MLDRILLHSERCGWAAFRILLLRSGDGVVEAVEAWKVKAHIRLSLARATTIQSGQCHVLSNNRPESCVGIIRKSGISCCSVRGRGPSRQTLLVQLCLGTWCFGFDLLR